MLAFFQVFFAVPLLFFGVRWSSFSRWIFTSCLFFWQLVERNLRAWFPFSIVLSHDFFGMSSVIFPEISEALFPLPLFPLPHRDRNQMPDSCLEV